MKTNASVLTFVGELPVTTPWGATNACAPPASSTNSSVEDAKTSMNVALRRPPAAMAVPILRAATYAAVHQVTSELAKGKLCHPWACLETLSFIM